MTRPIDHSGKAPAVPSDTDVTDLQCLASRYPSLRDQAVRYHLVAQASRLRLNDPFVVPGVWRSDHEAVATGGCGCPSEDLPSGGSTQPLWDGEVEVTFVSAPNNTHAAMTCEDDIDPSTLKASLKFQMIPVGVFEGKPKFDERIQVRGKYLYAIDEGFEDSKAGKATQPRSRVVFFDISNPQRAQFIGSFGSYGSGAGQFKSPDGLAISADGKRLTVADQGNRRVIVFDLEPLQQVIE